MRNRNERVTVTITKAQTDLLDDLSRFPKRDKATRIRDLAMIGLAVARGGGVVTTAAVAPAVAVSPSEIEMSPEAIKREKKMARFKGAGGIMGSPGGGVGSVPAPDQQA